MATRYETRLIKRFDVVMPDGSRVAIQAWEKLTIFEDINGQTTVAGDNQWLTTADGQPVSVVAGSDDQIAFPSGLIGRFED